MPSARGEWREGWTMVLASAAAMSMGPLHLYTQSVFVEPLEAEFGWSRMQSSSGLAVLATVVVIFAPFIGYLADRLGPRPIGIAGLATFCLSFTLLTTATGSEWQWWLLWGVVGLGVLGTKPTIWATAVASRFNAARGLALALIMSGISITAIIAPQVARFLIDNYGWRWGYAGIALLWTALAMPLVLMFFYGAQDLDRRDRRKRKDASHTPPAARPVTGVAFGEAVRSSSFIRLALLGFMMTMVLSGSIAHLVPLLTSRGVDRETAASLAGVLGIGSLAGRLIIGICLDRFDARLIGLIAFALPILPLLSLITMDGDGTVLFIAAIAILGISAGAEIEVLAYLTSRYFGIRAYGTLFGIIIALATFATGVGPSLAGYAFDLVGSYRPAMIAATGLCIAAALLIATLGSYGAAEQSAPPEN